MCVLFVKWIAGPGSMHETGCSGLVYWDDLGVGWGGRWEGDSEWETHVHPWLIHVVVWQKPLQYCKVISKVMLQFNFLNKCLERKKKEGSQERVVSIMVD